MKVIMDGEIRAAQQLEVELKQCMYRLTRTIQLHKIHTNVLRETRAIFEQEEALLLQEQKKLKEAEAVHKRETVAIKDTLAAKSAEFSELTSSALDQLSSLALHRENEALHERIRNLKGQLEDLHQQTEDYPDIDEATIALQLATVEDLRRKHVEAAGRHQRVEALVSQALAARATRDHPDHLLEEHNLARQLEAAVQDMSELLIKGLVTSLRQTPARGSSVQQTRVEVLTRRLSVERDRGDALLRELTDCLAGRMRRNCPSSEQPVQSSTPLSEEEAQPGSSSRTDEQQV